MRRFDGWGKKLRARRGEGTGRMRYIKDIPRRAKNGFRSGTTPKPIERKTK
jgi:large subunit ribosomal protein L37e